MSVKRQFRQWGYEISQAWGRIAFGGRVAVGAAVSIGLALLVTRAVTAPLSKEIADLKKNLVIPENLDPGKVEEIVMNREKTANLQTSLTSWNARLDALMKRHTELDESLHPVIVAEVQKIFARCRVQLVSDTLVPPVQPAPPQSGRRRKSAEPPPPPPKVSPMGAFVHQYHVRGTFRQLQALLLLLEQSPYMLQARDLKLTAEGGGGALNMVFRLDIRYLKGSA